MSFHVIARRVLFPDEAISSLLVLWLSSNNQHLVLYLEHLEKDFHRR